MKMAKATEQDMDAALLLNQMLDELDNCNHPLRSPSFPVDVDGEFNESDPDWFDLDDAEHCQTVLKRIVKVLDKSPGCMNRVIWGFHTIMHNDICDPDSDVLDWHPDFHPVLAAREAKKKEMADTTTGTIPTSAPDNAAVA